MGHAYAAVAWANSKFKQAKQTPVTLRHVAPDTTKDNIHTYFSLDKIYIGMLRGIPDQPTAAAAAAAQSGKIHQKIRI